MQLEHMTILVVIERNKESKEGEKTGAIIGCANAGGQEDVESGPPNAWDSIYVLVTTSMKKLPSFLYVWKSRVSFVLSSSCSSLPPRCGIYDCIWWPENSLWELVPSFLRTELGLSVLVASTFTWEAIMPAHHQGYSFIFKNDLLPFSYFMYMNVLCAWVYVYHQVCLVPTEIRRGLQIPKLQTPVSHPGPL